MGSVVFLCLRGLADTRADTEKARTPEVAEEQDATVVATLVLVDVLNEDPRPVANDILCKCV